MKKILSIILTVTMVFSLVAAFRAPTAKAAATLTATPVSGTFSGGTDAAGGGTDAIGTITAIPNATTATITLVTKGTGVFGTSPNVTRTTTLPLNVGTSTDADWLSTGLKWITFDSTSNLRVGDTISVAGATPGVGTVQNIVSATEAVVQVSTAQITPSTTVVTVTTECPLGSVNSTDPLWKTGTVSSSYTVVLTSTATLRVGDQITVAMDADTGTKATASFTLGGTITAGNSVVVAWYDTGAVLRTTAAYIVPVGGTLTTVTAAVVAAINAVVAGTATASTYTITLTQDAVGLIGNGKTFAVTIAEGSTSLTIKTLGGLNQPAYVEFSKTIQLVARDQLGADVTASATWTFSGTSVANVVAGLVTASVGTAGPSTVTATLSSGVTASFVVNVISVQTITSLTVTPNPANLTVSAGATQQFNAIAASATYSQLDYTTQVTWADDLPVATISITGLLTYSSAESGRVYASTPGLSNLAIVTIGTTGVFPTTGAATSVTSTGATLNGTTGTSAPSASFFWYGPTSAGPFTTTSSLPAGWTSVAASPAVTTASTPFAAVISGLIAGQVYYFVAWNTVASVHYPGAVLSFTTTGIPSGGLPTCIVVTDTAKKVSATNVLRWFEPVPNDGTLKSATDYYHVYNMGDIIHGYLSTDGVTVRDPLLMTAMWKVELIKDTGVVVDTVNVSAYTSYFTMGTGNVSEDGLYFLRVWLSGGQILYCTYPVYIKYNIVFAAETIKSCPGMQTISGWITRGNGQTVLVPVNVFLTYPDKNPGDGDLVSDFDYAAYYTVAPMSSGQFTLTFNIDRSGDGFINDNELGYFYVYVSDGYNGDASTLPQDPVINTNDAIVYKRLSNIPSDFALNLSTYVNPTLLYKAQDDQPVLLQLLDQTGAPVEDATFTVKYEDGTAIVVTPTEVSPGYYRFELDLASSGTHSEVRFMANKSIYGVSKDSNLVIIPLRDKGPFNPYIDVDFGVTPAEDNGEYYDYYGKYLDQDVYWRLPCTIGTLINIKVALWPVADSTNWKIYKVTPKISGPIKLITDAAYGYVLGDAVYKNRVGYYGTYLITGPGKITASISAKIWERVSDKCEFNEYNACCYDYSKTFEICEIAACSVDKVALTNGAQIDDTTIEVGKKADLVLSISDGGDIECGCNSKVVWMYMVDGDGNPVEDAFTMNTYGTGTKTLDEIWWNPMNAYGTGGGIIGADNVARLYPPLPYQPILFGATDNSLMIKDNCSTLTFSGLQFNYPNAEDCEYTLVVKVFGLKRTYDACGNLTIAYPMVAELINPVDIIASVTELSTTATIIEAGLDPDKILAGVPVTIELTDPGFDPDYSYDVSVWLNSIDASLYNKVGFATWSETDTGIRINFSKAFGSEDGYGNPLEKIIIYGYQYNDPDGECKSKAEFMVELPVVMPEFTVEIGLLDGTKIPNDGILTEGFGEIAYVTPVDPRGIHDFANDSWTLDAYNTTDACGLATDYVDHDIVPGECCGRQAIKIVGYDNPCVEDEPLVDLYFSMNSADIYVSSFTLVKPTVALTLEDIYGNKIEKAPVTVPPTLTHVIFNVKDAHGHGAPGVYIEVSFAEISGSASGYTSWDWTDNYTNKDGESDWVYPFTKSGKYYVSAGMEDDILPVCLVEYLGWGINTSATFEAVYVAPVLDTTKPVVEASAPATVTSPMVTVTGKVSDNVGVVSLWIGAMKVDFAPDGTFSAKVDVAEGANTIKVVAFDAAGNMGEKTLTVTYAVPKVTVVKVQIGSDIMIVNGKAVQIDAPAEIMNGRTFLPLRAISEALGATVDWIAETQGITVTLGENTIGLQIGNTSAVVNGTVMTLDAAPYIKNNRTMVPFRVIAEGLGATVEWDPALRIVTVTLAQ